VQNKREKHKSTGSVPVLPASCTSMWINFVGVAGFFVGIWFLRQYPYLPDFYKLLIAMASYAVPIAVLELIFLKTHRRPSTGYDFAHKNPVNWGRVGIKLSGFYLTLTLVGCGYSLFPEYQGGPFGFAFIPEKFSGGFYAAFWDFLQKVIPYMAIAAVPYFIYMDRYTRKHEDGYWQAGQLLLLRWDRINGPRLTQHMLGWLVKAFFLPLMYVFLVGSINYQVSMDYAQAFANPGTIFNYLYETCYTVDLVIVTVGYITAVKLLDSHIRSSEPTFDGWFWAVICYQPFWSMLYDGYFSYDVDGFGWGNLVAGNQTLWMIWASMILFVTAVYAWASVSFGLRFSNLTNRGILTNGAYRYTKHPAYVSKNISWWLISVPFIAHPNTTFWGIIGDCLMLLGVNFIYYMRARTEERHLSSDPVYVEYALAMNERSIFSWVGRLFPFLRYKPYPKLVEIDA
jgi:protein-S-isoprenylcysteine O-methyltransferase Ste14